MLSTQILVAQKYIQVYQDFLNTTGSPYEKITYSLEYGKQWDVYSLGFNVGKINNFAFTEVKSNLNVFQQGKFTNTLTFGLGYIVNSNTNLLTEISSGIEYSYSNKTHFNIQFGQYYFSGSSDSNNTTFFGISTIYFLKK